MTSRRNEWGHILIIGLFQTTGVMGLIVLSLQTIAAESSILTFTNPLLVVILAPAFAGARYRIRQWLGVVMGFGWRASRKSSILLRSPDGLARVLGYFIDR